jgi:hypothetical protein
VVYILGLLVADVEDQRVCERATAGGEEKEDEEVMVLMLVLVRGLCGARAMDGERGSVIVFPGFIVLLGELASLSRAEDEMNRRAPERLIPVTAAAVP